MNAVNPQQNSQAAKPKDPRKVVTPKCRLNYAWVFSPRAGPNGGKESYSATLVFEPGTDLSSLKIAARTAATQKWGDKIPKFRNNPFRSCSDRAGQEGFVEGGVFITARNSKSKPGLYDQRKQPILSDDVLYSGCYVRASLFAHAFNFQGNPGVTFILKGLQKMGDGERLDNRGSADDFEPLPGADDDMFGPDSKDDEIPF